MTLNLANAQITATSSSSGTVTNAVSRGLGSRIFDTINVVDFGADPTGAADSTTAIQNAINCLANGRTIFGQTGAAGRVYFPLGKYLVGTNTASGDPILTLPTGFGTVKQSIILEGAGGSGNTAGLLTAGNGNNSFILDDLSLTNNGQTNNPVVIRNLFMRNLYDPKAIYKIGLVTSPINAAWNYGDPTIVVTNASVTTAGGLDSGGGQILFATTFGSASDGIGYLGYVAPGGVSVGGSNTTLTLGDTGPKTAGAQLQSNPSASSTLTAVQGYFAASSFAGAGNSTTPATITMAASNPTNVNGGAGLDPGFYYVWDWQTVLAGQSIIPKCTGVVQITGTAAVPTGGWVGTTLTLTMGTQHNSVGSSDLLVLTPISGCVRHVATRTATIEDCNFTGIIPISFQASMITGVSGQSSTGWLATVRNCQIQAVPGSWGIGCHGIMTAQASMLLNCDINAAWIGARLLGVNNVVIGGRQEICCYSTVIGGVGHNVGGGDNTASTFFTILSTEMEGCWAAAITNDTASNVTGLISGIVVSFNHFNSCYGFYLNQGNTLTVMNCSLSSGGVGTATYGGTWNPSLQGPGVPSAIYIGDNAGRITFISVFAESSQGTFGTSNGLNSGAWRLPSNQKAAKFISCNQPPNPGTFASLPASVTVTGSISDGTGSAAGQILNITAGASGSNLPGVGGTVTGTGVTANTYITNMSISGNGQNALVNNSQLVGSRSLTLYPMVDGDEYFITNGPSTAVWGDPITSGSSSTRMKIRWDAPNSQWIRV